MGRTLTKLPMLWSIKDISQLISRHAKNNLAYQQVLNDELWRISISIVKELIHSRLEGFSDQEIKKMKV